MGVVSNAVSLALPSLLVLLSLVMKTSLAELERLEHQTRRGDGSLNFLVVGDWGRKGSYNQSNVAFQMGRIGEKLDIDFVISTGDNFYSNGLSGVEDPTFYESFKNIYTPKSLQKPWYTILGNHDYRGNVSAQISPLLRDIDDRWFCYRSFLLSSEFVDFIFVDTTPFVNEYFTKPKKNIYDWSGVTPQDKYIADLLEDVETALKKSSGKWKIVIGHHTIRSAGPVGDTIELVEKLLPILEVYNVDFFINGHEHCLQHISPTTNGIKFLTSGGGSKTKKSIAKEVDGLKFYHDGQGFMSMEMKKNEVRIVFYDVYGYSLHHFNVYKQPNLPLSTLGMCPANNEIVGMCFGNNAVEK